MSEFVELEEWWGIRRSKIIGYRVLPALITPIHRKPSVVVWVDGMPEDFQVEFDTLEQAEAAARKIGGVSQSEVTEWADSRIIDPSLSINFRTQESPILWGRWHDGSEAPFRVRRGSDGVAKCVGIPPVNAPWPMPDFWRHLPVAEKMEILDRIHKAKTEGVSDEG